MSADWDREWEVAWKAHPRNPWFHHQADCYADWLGPIGPGRVLKTDAFDEACGFDPLAAAGARVVVHMDVSGRILAVARQAGVALAVATDARQLAFRPGSFDLVFSPSTLDHFDDVDEIARAVAELAAALRPGGRLLLTLDNPSNPILRLRAAVHRRTGRIGGLIPFRMGRTLSRRRASAVVADAGLDVIESGYLVHTPRAIGLWLGELAARGGYARVALALRGVFGALDRVAAVLPTRRWTGHFVVVDGSRPSGPLQPRRADPLMRLLAVHGEIESRVRCAYLRVLPRPVLARIDPPLRRAVTHVRRAAATPLYLRHRIARWSGRCADETARAVTWGKAGSPRTLFHLLFDDEPAVTWEGPLGLPGLLRDMHGVARDADVVIAETTPALSGGFTRRGFLIVPGSVRVGADVETLVATLARPSSSLASDLARVRRTGYRSGVWSYTRARSRFAHRRYLLPHAYARFLEDATPPDAVLTDRLFAAGRIVTATRPGADDPDALGLVVPRGDLLWFVALGTRDSDPTILDAGGLAALYLAAIDLARERGMRWVDAGRCRPWRSDGVMRFKWKWGFRPIADTAQTLEYAVKILRPESAAARRLAEHGVIVRAGRRFLRLGSDGRLGEP